MGVSIKKLVGNRKITKNIHVRIEHLRKSRCRETFIARINENDRLKNEASKKGQRISTKR